MKIMAVDFGDTRTGLAMCDRTEFLASPLGVITEKSLPKTVEKIVYAAAEYEARMIVVGLPLNMNGTEGERAQRCRKVADMLKSILPDMPVELWDERGTTISATRIMNETDTRGKKRKETLDAAAAAIILECYLAYRKNHPVEEK
ncbi:MAG: Holliday junction resolvase RuvX [Oscillospiraceae bacterium]